MKKAGFKLDEYGGKTNAYAVFVHDCGIVANVEYKFVRTYPGRDSWHAGDVTYFGWYDDPDYHRWSTESTKKFGKKFGKKFNESVNASMEYALSDWEDDFNESHGLEGDDKLNLGFYIGYETPGMFSIWGSTGFDGEQYMEEAVNELVQKFGLKKIGDIGHEGGGVVQYFEWDLDKWGIPETNYFPFMTDKGWTDKPGEVLEGMLEYGYNIWEPAMRELFNPSK